jgi:serine/threonine protein kinase
LKERLLGEKEMYDLVVRHAEEEREREIAHQKQRILGRINKPQGLVDHHDPGTDGSTIVTFEKVEHGFLGKGSFGEVYKVAEKSTGVVFACKSYHVDLVVSAGRQEKDVIQEVENMQKLRHRHIPTVLFHAKVQGTFRIFMSPVADCNLQDFMEKCTKNNFPASMTGSLGRWYGCLMDALAYAHSCKIKHRDIKPANVLIKDNAPYLSDFGLAKDFSTHADSRSRDDHGHGNLKYRAPEVKPNGDHGRAADVFSMGCVFSEMFTVSQGRPLQQYESMRGKMDYRLCIARVREWITSLEVEPSSGDGIIKDEIIRILQENDNLRPTAQQALERLKREPSFFCVESR